MPTQPNFGILQGAPTPGITSQAFSTPPRPDVAQQDVNSFMGVLGQADAMRTNAAQRASAQQGILKSQQEMQQSAQLFPGQLKTQALLNAGTSSDNIIKQAQADAAQRQAAHEKAADAAYTAALQSGKTPDQALQMYGNNLDPASKIKFDDSMTSHKDAVAKGNLGQLTAAAGMVQGFHQDMASTLPNETPQAKAARIQQSIGYLNNQLDRIDPDHPQLHTVSDVNHYGIATFSTLMDPKVQQTLQIEKLKANLEVQKTKTEVNKAQDYVDQTKSDLNVAIQSGDNTAIKEAQAKLDAAQQGLNKSAYGTTILGEVRAAANAPENQGTMASIFHGPTSSATSAAQAPAASVAPAVASTGKPVIDMSNITADQVAQAKAILQQRAQQGKK